MAEQCRRTRTAACGIEHIWATPYFVTQRTKEIGLRTALGATGAGVLQVIMRSALWQVGTGFVIGLPAAVLTARAAASQLYGR
jgi:ABC-type antimicrobial peptide transport system permease subunit